MNRPGTEKSQTGAPKAPASRKKFLLQAGALSLLAAVAIKLPVFSGKKAIACAPQSSGKKIKMLTQDGSLVEIDESLISAERRKISEQELRQWIKAKNPIQHETGK